MHLQGITRQFQAYRQAVHCIAGVAQIAHLPAVLAQYRHPSLGIALDLYYDDDAELQAFAERERKQTELNDLKRLMPPASIAQLLQRAASNWQINAPDICNTLACNIHELMKMDPAAAWQKLVEHYEQRNS